MTKKVKAKKPKKKNSEGEWYPAYRQRLNEERRERYGTDEAYREQKKEIARENYRAKNGGGVTKDCRDNLKTLAKMGRIRYVYSKRGKAYKAVSFLGKELARALCYSPAAIYRMTGDGRLPKPSVRIVYGEGVAPPAGMEFVFLEAEVRAMIKVLGAHQENLRYYSINHVDTIADLTAAVLAARKREK